MQASSSVPASTLTPPFHPQSAASTSNAALTIDPAALFGGGSGSSSSAPAPVAGPSASGTGASNSIHGSALHSPATNSIAVKQEPDDEHASSLIAPRHPAGLTEDAGVSGSSARQRSTSASPRSNDKSQLPGSNQHNDSSKAQLKDEPASLVAQLLQSDHKAILRPDLSAFVDARDVLRRLLPYHVWNIPHHDLLKALDLKHDPVLGQVRSRKRRRIARSEGRSTAMVSSKDAAEATAEVAASDLKPSEEEEAGQKDLTGSTSEATNGLDQHISRPVREDDDERLNELGLPTPLPEVPLPAFPTLDFTESVFARRDALASRFQRTLTALDTTHKRAPNTSLSLEHLERLAYSDDREEVLAKIEELKSLKLELETLEENRQIDVAQSSAKISLSFGITDEIEREREKERELERIKRQQERAAAKAAKLEKEREARHRLGIFTPPPEPKTPAPPSPVSTSAATPAPSAVPVGSMGAGGPATGSLAMPSPYSGLSTPAGTPGAYPFPPGANLPHVTSMSMPPPGPNGFAAPSPLLGPPIMYGSMPGTPNSSAPSFASTSAAPMLGANGVPMGTSTSAPFVPATVSMPGTPSAPSATPSKPPSKSKAKAAAAAAASAPGTPGTPDVPGTPGVTPGPTPHRGRGRPRKHPLPGTPGGPPIPVPRKKKDKPAKPPAAAASTPGTPNAQGAAAMSPPLPPGAAAPGLQARPPPSPSPVPPTMPGPAPGYSGEMFSSTLPPTPASVRPATGSPPGNAASPMTVRPPTMHPTLTSATSLNTPRATPPARPSPSPAPTPARPAPAAKKTPAKANGARSSPATSAATTPAAAPPAAPTSAASNANPSIPNHPIPLLIPVASLPRLSALGIQPTPSPHIRPLIGPNGVPQGLQGAPIAIDPAQSVPAVLLGISEGTAEPGADGGAKQQILHISVVLSRLSPSQLSGLAVLMQSLQAQVEAGKRK